MSEIPKPTKLDPESGASDGRIVSVGGIMKYPESLLSQAIETREAAREAIKDAASRAETTEITIPEMPETVQSPAVAEPQYVPRNDPPGQLGGAHQVPSEIRNNLPPS